MTDWPIKTLGEVCDLSTGGTPSTGNKAYYDGGQIRWLRSGDVHQREIHDCDGRITEEGMQNANTRYLPLNSVLIALAGQGKTRGTVAMLRTKATCNQSVVSIMPIDVKTLLPEFVFWNLHMKYDEIRRMTGDDGNDRRGLNMRLIRSMTVPIAPLAEQRRIVALLDAATARVTELTECYEQARTHANNLFTSALREALESNPDWPVKTLGEVVRFDSETARPEDLSSKDVYVGLENISSDGTLIGLGNVSAETLKSNKARFTDNHILFGKLRPYLAKVVRPDFSGVCSTDILPLQPTAEISRDFLFWYLRSPAVIDAATEASTGTTLPRVSPTTLKTFEISVPPLEEQKKIVVHLDSMRAKTSEMVAAYDAKLAAAKDLRQSMLEAAFAGEL